MGEYASLDTKRSQQPRSPTVAKDSPRFSKAAEGSAAHQSSISGSGGKFAIIPFELRRFVSVADYGCLGLALNVSVRRFLC